MPNRRYTAADIVMILADKRAGIPARETAARLNASGGNPTTIASIRDARRKWAKFEPDAAAIEAQMMASRESWYSGKSRQQSAEERAALAKRVVEMTKRGMGRAEIAAELNTSYSHIAYLRRHAAAIGLTDAKIKPKKQYPKESFSRPEPDRQYVAKTRTCLVHGGPFESEWPGERVCKRCKNTTGWRMGA